LLATILPFSSLRSDHAGFPDLLGLSCHRKFAANRFAST